METVNNKLKQRFSLFSKLNEREEERVKESYSSRHILSLTRVYMCVCVNLKKKGCLS